MFVLASKSENLRRRICLDKMEKAQRPVKGVGLLGWLILSIAEYIPMIAADSIARREPRSKFSAYKP
jgi:hypothetical protein